MRFGGCDGSRNTKSYYILYYKMAKGKKAKWTWIDFFFPKWLFPYKMDLTDERIPKLLGLVLVLISIYLSVALTSYLWSWQADQDEVRFYSWGLLFKNDVHIENALGRLGALVSHILMFDGFGLPSFALIFFLFL